MLIIEVLLYSNTILFKSRYYPSSELYFFKTQNDLQISLNSTF